MLTPVCRAVGWIPCGLNFQWRPTFKLEFSIVYQKLWKFAYEYERKFEISWEWNRDRGTVHQEADLTQVRRYSSLKRL